MLLAERLAVAQEGRAGERIDLGAGIVDIIFAGDGEAGEGEQIGERIAEHRAAAMCRHASARLDWPRHIPRSPPRPCRSRSGRRRRPAPAPCAARSARTASAKVRLMKPGPAISTLSICGSEASSGTMRSASARGGWPAALASTMAALVARSPWREVLGRLERDAVDARLVRHHAVMLELLDRGENPPVEPCKNVHGSSGKTMRMILSENRCPLFRIMLGGD